MPVAAAASVCLFCSRVYVLVKVAQLTLRRHMLQALGQTQHLCLARRLRCLLYGNYKQIDLDDALTRYIDNYGFGSAVAARVTR